jgi:hypothetical protein
MTSPKIQKDLVKACAHETRNAIMDELGGRLFVGLVDESRDKSIKEQMVCILRFVALFLSILQIHHCTSCIELIKLFCHVVMSMVMAM